MVFVCWELYISVLRLGYISCIMRPVRSSLCWEWFVIKPTAGQCPGQPFSHCWPAGPTTPATRQGSPSDWPLSTSYNWTAPLYRNTPPANYQVKRRTGGGARTWQTSWSDLVSNGTDGIAFPSVTSPTGTDLRIISCRLYI